MSNVANLQTSVDKKRIICLVNMRLWKIESCVVKFIQLFRSTALMTTSHTVYTKVVTVDKERNRENLKPQGNLNQEPNKVRSSM